MVTATGAAKVIPSEQDLSARGGATSGIYLAAAAPLVRGDTAIPFLVTSPQDFLNKCTPNGVITTDLDQSYLEVLTALTFTNKLWLSRASNGALYGAAFIRAQTSSYANFPAEFGIGNILTDYDLTSADGRPAVPASVVTPDNNESVLSVPANFFALLETGDKVRISTTGTLPSPLVALTDYYVHMSATMPNAIGLCASQQDANSGNIIDIVSFGIGTHTITAQVKLATSDFIVNTSTNVATVTAGFYAAAETGDAVLVTAGTTFPAPLLALTNYYVIQTQTLDQIQLASSLANAQAGIPIDPTTVGVGTLNMTFVNKVNTGTATVDQSNGVFTISNLTFYGELQIGDEVQFTTQTGVMPTGLDTSTIYYAIPLAGQKMQIATSLLNAQNRVAIDFANPGSGIIEVSNLSIVPTPSNQEKVLLFYGASQGKYNNNLALTLTNYATNTLLVKVPGSFLVSIYNGTSLVESWHCSRNPLAKDGSNQSMYVEDVLKSSNWMRAIDNVAIDASVLPQDQLTLLALAGGSDGNAVADGDMVNALNRFTSADQFPIAIVADMGWATPAYHEAIVNFCDPLNGGRGDCAFVIAPPFEAEAQSDYMSGIVGYKTMTLNSTSSYGGMWASSILIEDADNNREIYVSPSGHVAGKICNTWANFQAWQPVAGSTFGVLNVLGVHLVFSPGEMDVLQDNSINPIRWKIGGGTVIWGQKTLQVVPSDLDRMNARLLLCVIKSAIKTLLEAYLFSLDTISNTGGIRTAIIARLDTYMRAIEANNGVYDYQIICDGTNNSDADIENHTINVWLLVKITDSVEYIPFVIGITPYGTTFQIAAGQII
jgi:hypothetical protein